MSKIKYLFLFALVWVSNSYAWTQTPPRPMQACAVDAPYGFPQGKNGVPLCRLAYATVFDSQAKLPIWTVWTLTPSEALGCVPRSNVFTRDQSVPNSPTPEDYAGTGFDKGHVAPNGDMNFDQQVANESFLMTNMVPQIGNLNRGIWKLLETWTRTYVVQRNTSVTVYAGPIYNYTNKTIGTGVVIPQAFYKIVIDNKTNEVFAFLFPHSGIASNDLDVVLSSVVAIESQTGLQFPLPQGAQGKRTKDVPIDYNVLTSAKKAKCKD